MNWIYTLLNFLRPESNNCLTEEERQWLRTLYEQHQVRDQNGRLLWYLPPGLIDDQKKAIELVKLNDRLLKELTVTNAKIADTVRELVICKQQTLLLLEKLIQRL